MAWRSVAACLVLTMLLAGGQILFKFAAASIDERKSVSWLNALSSPWLVSALIVYAASTSLWIYILTREPLSKAYPFTLAGAALVPLLANLIFTEPLSARYWLGIAAILCGIALTQTS